MSVMYRVVFEKPPSKGLQRLVNRFGADALPRWENEREVADRLGLTALTKFGSMTLEEARNYIVFLARLGRDVRDKAEALAAYRESWFEPSDGLRTVRGLIQAVEADPTLVGSRYEISIADAVVEDLKELEKILIKAEAEALRFHLTE
jgi:hypothetical protein